LYRLSLAARNLPDNWNVSPSITSVRNRRAVAFSLLSAWLALAGANGAGFDDEPVFDMGPGIIPPRVTHQVTPVNKPNATGFRISGVVLVGLVVSSHGEPRDIHVVKSLDKDVDQSAIEAVQQWSFEPARKGDQSVAVRITVEIRFHSM
jgi:TonB family protein